MKHNIRETIYLDGDYFISLLEDIKHAKDSVDFEVYMYNDDAAGKLLTRSLINAAKRGVKIRILVDGIGTTWRTATAEAFTKHGVEAKIFHPLPWNIHQWIDDIYISKPIIEKIIYLFSKINTRNHRKLCIIDNNIVYVGSANITEHLISKDPKEIWRETTVKIIGAPTDLLRACFENACGYISHLNLPSAAGTQMFCLNYSWQLRRANLKRQIRTLQECKHRIWVTNAYFVPYTRLLRELLNAQKRGVDVIILLPQLSDILVTKLAAKAFYITLLHAGVKIFEYKHRILHAKLLIVDDWFLVGTSNFNYRSMWHDLEIDVNIQTIEAKKVLEQQFLEDISQSQQIRISDFNEQFWLQNLLGRLILIFRYWI